MKQAMKQIFFHVSLLWFMVTVADAVHVADSTRVERAPKGSMFETLPYAWKENLRNKPVETEFEALPHNSQTNIVSRIKQSMLSSRFKMPSETAEKYYQNEMTGYVNQEKDLMKKSARLKELLRENTEVAAKVRNENKKVHINNNDAKSLITTMATTITTGTTTTTTISSSTTTTSSTLTTTITTTTITAATDVHWSSTMTITTIITTTSKSLITAAPVKTNNNVASKSASSKVGPPWKVQKKNAGFKARSADPPGKILKGIVGNMQVRPAPTESQGVPMNTKASAWKHHLSDPEPPKIIGIAVTSMAFCGAIWAASRRPAMSQAPQFKPHIEPAF